MDVHASPALQLPVFSEIPQKITLTLGFTLEFCYKEDYQHHTGMSVIYRLVGPCQDESNTEEVLLRRETQAIQCNNRNESQ